MNQTRELRGRPITHMEAAVAAQRLINSHFHNPDSARVQIPASPWDDDLIIMDYIEEQKEIHNTFAALQSLTASMGITEQPSTDALTLISDIGGFYETMRKALQEKSDLLTAANAENARLRIVGSPTGHP